MHKKIAKALVKQANPKRILKSIGDVVSHPVVNVPTMLVGGAAFAPMSLRTEEEYAALRGNNPVETYLNLVKDKFSNPLGVVSGSFQGLAGGYAASPKVLVKAIKDSIEQSKNIKAHKNSFINFLKEKNPKGDAASDELARAQWLKENNNNMKVYSENAPADFILRMLKLKVLPAGGVVAAGGVEGMADVLSAVKQVEKASGNVASGTEGLNVTNTLKKIDKGADSVVGSMNSIQNVSDNLSKLNENVKGLSKLEDLSVVKNDYDQFKQFLKDNSGTLAAGGATLLSLPFILGMFDVWKSNQIYKNRAKKSKLKEKEYNLLNNLLTRQPS